MVTTLETVCLPSPEPMEQEFLLALTIFLSHLCLTEFYFFGFVLLLFLQGSVILSLGTATISFVFTANQTQRNQCRYSKYNIEKAVE